MSNELTGHREIEHENVDSKEDGKAHSETARSLLSQAACDLQKPVTVNHPGDGYFQALKEKLPAAPDEQVSELAKETKANMGGKNVLKLGEQLELPQLDFSKCSNSTEALRQLPGPEQLENMAKSGQNLSPAEKNALNGFIEFPDNYRAGYLGGLQRNNVITQSEQNELNGFREFPKNYRAGYLGGLERNHEISSKDKAELNGFREFPANARAGFLAGLERKNEISDDERIELREYRRHR